jgi:hypothetical protein
MMVKLKRISVALGLLVATGGVSARAQGLEPGGNQVMADRIAATLRASRPLATCRIAIETRDGMATLSGVVASQAQRAEAIERARSVPGVLTVNDQLRVGGDARVQPAQYQPALERDDMVGGDVIADVNVPIGSQPGGPGAAPFNDGPLPEGPAGQPASSASVPRYPNYAWPTYAPYPNFSAVGYPLVYPWNAWPNIGPFYPYPEVPPDWRAVTAQYHDGVWNLKFRSNYTRPFILPWPIADLLNRNY